MAKKANIYIDGFNLYRGRLKDTSFRWLDLGALCNRLFPDLSINKIRYFTATVMAFSHDPQAPIRQDVYLWALDTIPNLTVHKEGWFTSYPIMLPRHPLVFPNGPSQKPEFVEVLRNEEKRTDVDLATHLLLDCFLNDFEEAVVVSNDADLVLPVQVVRTIFKKRIGVLNPHRTKKLSSHLRAAASYHRDSIKNRTLKACQFPDPVIDPAGRQIAKPLDW